MLVRIPHVLGARQLEQVATLLAGASYVDGRLSAGAAARRVKTNEELSGDDSAVQDLNTLIMGSLVRHPVYRFGALPLRIAAPYFARYQEGMSYGDHVDDPVMGSEARYRSDISITVFLSSPESYGGGELVIRTSFGEQAIKYPAGDAVMYPSSSMHHVNPVTTGTRTVAVTWVQSMVRDAARRELLFELGKARDHLLRHQPESEAARQVERSYVNLLRMWAEV